MVVDDSQVTSMVLSNILTEHGFEIVGTFRTGEDGIKNYSTLKPDLVTMDIVLPGIDGVETIRRLVELDSKARVVVISSVGSSPQKIMDAFEAGALSIVSKPFEEDKLIKILNKVLEAY